MSAAAPGPDAAALDRVFWALSDATRRSVIEQLARGPASVSELARPHAMSLPGFMKHLRVLEEAGLVLRAKEGRTVRCELAPAALDGAAGWIGQQGGGEASRRPGPGGRGAARKR